MLRIVDWLCGRAGGGGWAFAGLCSQPHNPIQRDPEGLVDREVGLVRGGPEGGGGGPEGISTGIQAGADQVAVGGEIGGGHNGFLSIEPPPARG